MGKQGFGHSAIVWGVALAMVASTAWGTSPGADRQGLLEQLKHAARGPIRSGIFEGQYRRTHRPKRPSDAEIDAEVSRFEKELRQQIAAGTYRFSQRVRDRLKALYGTEDYTRLAGDPEVETQKQLYIEDAVKNWRERLLDRYVHQEDRSNVRYSISPDLQLRVERKITDSKRNGQASEIGMRQSRVLVVGHDISKEYSPDLQQGRIKYGSRSDPTEFTSVLGDLQLLQAGRPYNTMVQRGGWQPQNIKSTQEEESSQGRILTVVFSQQLPNGKTRTAFLSVLPDRDFAVLREEYYEEGRLKMRFSFDDYRELAGGLWYPMKQVQEFFTAELDPAVAALVAAGQLDFASDKVRESQIIIGSTVREILLSHVEVNVPIDPALFRMDFPAGTYVLDFTKPDDQGMPLHIPPTPKGTKAH